MCSSDLPRLVQLYATRNVAVSPVLNALMGGLPHHSAHHAFPWIAAARLPRASDRIEAVLGLHGWPQPPRLRSYAHALPLLWRPQAARRCSIRYGRPAQPR